MKNFLVIGASSGIGLATAQILAQNNQVFATYNTSPISNSSNLNYSFLNVLEDTLDLSFLPEKLDGLVYCPGSINLKPFARITPDDFLNDYKLQVLGAVKVIQQVLPKLKLGNNANIVLFSTVAMQLGFNFHSQVATHKGAIEGLTKALAAELAPTVRVNCIAPSITNTKLAANILNTPEKIEANAQRHPLKQIGTANDIAQMAAFLLNDTAKWITGQIIHVDGGMSAIK
jgi:NAD(P)-dependent dehydrogenase (short-subunit alcohol dehydrogenase family)